MTTLGIIPARFGSTRLEGKPLAMIGNKTMIERVFEQCLASKSLQKVVAATDDQRIFDAVRAFGGEVLMTQPTHQNGTSRCGEAYTLLNQKFDVVVNIQGDEPFINPKQIDELVAVFNENSLVDIATLVRKIDDLAVLNSVSTPKVVRSIDGKALYFSRSVVPHLRGIDPKDYLKHHIFYQHIGIYAYRFDVLAKINTLEPTFLEQAECLEQLRWLENGFNIFTNVSDFNSFAIDTPEDLAVANALCQTI